MYSGKLLGRPGSIPSRSPTASEQRMRPEPTSQENAAASSKLRRRQSGLEIACIKDLVASHPWEDCESEMGRSASRCAAHSRFLRVLGLLEAVSIRGAA